MVRGRTIGETFAIVRDTMMDRAEMGHAGINAIETSHQGIETDGTETDSTETDPTETDPTEMGHTETAAAGAVAWVAAKVVAVVMAVAGGGYTTPDMTPDMTLSTRGTRRGDRCSCLSSSSLTTMRSGMEASTTQIFLRLLF